MGAFSLIVVINLLNSYHVHVMTSYVVKPLKTATELLSWKPEDISCDLNPLVPGLPSSYPGLPSRRRTLVCHDFKGGYGKDNAAFGLILEPYTYEEDYRFFHWDKCDLFVYFSHHFITIPPVGWIAAAHRNGTPILGTLITEHDEGVSNCCQFLQSKEVAEKTADQLVLIAQNFKLDGWLINIENELKVEQLPELVEWLRYLRLKLHAAIPNSHLMWYDSVRADNGKLDWQNELNYLNKPFYLACDSIYLNYAWNEDKLAVSKVNSEIEGSDVKSESSEIEENYVNSECSQIEGSEVDSECSEIEGSEDRLACNGNKKRCYDVFVGIDVFGRGCYGGGMFCSDKAVEVCKQFDMSCAIFAPGWTLECRSSDDYCGEQSFLKRDQLLWSSMAIHLPEPKPTFSELPFKTNFNFGFRNYSGADGMQIDQCYSLESTECLPVSALSRFIKNVEVNSENAGEGLNDTGLNISLSDFNANGELQILNLKFVQTKQLKFALSCQQLLQTYSLSVQTEASTMSKSSVACIVCVQLNDSPNHADLNTDLIQVQSKEIKLIDSQIDHVQISIKLGNVSDSVKEQIGSLNAFMKIKSVHIC